MSSSNDNPTFFHGQPWSSWIEKIGRDKPLSDDEPDSEPASSVMRLSVDDVDLYGFCPERDTFYGVLCEICNSVVKPQALTQHMESRHPSGNMNLPPPINSTTKPIMKTPYCKLSKLKKSQSSGQLSLTNNNGSSNNGNGATSKTSLNHTPVKHRTGGSESQPQPSLHPGSSPRSPLDSIPIGNNVNNGNAAIPSTGQLGTPASAIAATAGGFSSALSGVASAASPVKSPGNQPKRKRFKAERSLLKDREYDPDRHCGVWNEESGKPCTRSLTCKAHTVLLRRSVAGRSKSFDKLLADHRAAKESPAARGTIGNSQTKTVTSSVVATPSTSITNSIAPTAAVVAVSIATNITAVEPVSAASAPLVIDASTMVANSASLPDLDAPSSPPVLSLPDTYPLPQAVDLLYRCLAPHGSNKPVRHGFFESPRFLTEPRSHNDTANPNAPFNLYLQTKLEEDFANELDPSRRIDSSMVNSGLDTSNVVAITNNIGCNSNSSSSNNNDNNSSNIINNFNSGIVNNVNSNSSNNNNNNSSAALEPISVVLPSLSPIQSSVGGISPSQAVSLLQYNRGSSSPLSMEQIIVKQQSPVSVPVVPNNGSLLIGNQSTPIGNVVLEAKPAPMDIEQPIVNSRMYMSPVHQYKDNVITNKMNVRSSQSPSSCSSSFSSLFDTSVTSLLESQQHYNSLDTPMRNSHFASSMLTNGKQQQQQQRLSNNHIGFQSSGQSFVREIKSEYSQDYSTAIQLEATTASTPYPATSFEDITWSNHHPEPLAVSKWLRITSSRKQYNFNIH